MQSKLELKSPLAIITGMHSAQLQELIASLAFITQKNLEDLPLIDDLKISILPYCKVFNDSNLPTKELALMTLMTISENRMLTPYDKTTTTPI